MTLTIGRLIVEVERGSDGRSFASLSHVYVRVPRVGEMFLSLNDFKPEGKRIVFDREPDRAS